jgi:aromatic-L-amino-acid decarboxylase
MPDEDPLEPFRWHPEPEIIGAASRDALQRLGYATWDAALDYLFEEAARRAMGPPPDPAAFSGQAPHHPTPAADLLDDFSRSIAPHLLNAWHPRSLSWFTGPPLVMSVLGETLAQVTHQAADVWHGGVTATLVEEQVVRWLCDLVGYGERSFGLLTSGGVMANFIAMALARDVRLRALRGATKPPRGALLDGARVYTSDQTHFSVARALDELGFPPETLVVLPSDDAFRLPPSAVEPAIARDRAAGRQPFALVAAAGTTNTGSIDPLADLADIAEREGLWFHVDAAYGAAARFSARLAPVLDGIERADSVTVDPHKWFFQAYDVGGLVVRNGAHLATAFDRSPEYYRGERNERAIDFYKLGFEGTRRWRALKLWLSWRHVGSDGFGQLVDRTVDLARHLSARLTATADFELALPEPELSVVCFRHRPSPLADDAHHDAHQDHLAAALEADGDGWLTTTRLRDATWLRAGIVNYRTTEADLDRLIESLRGLAASTQPPGGPAA